MFPEKVNIPIKKANSTNKEAKSLKGFADIFFL